MEVSVNHSFEDDHRQGAHSRCIYATQQSCGDTLVTRALFINILSPHLADSITRFYDISDTSSISVPNMGWLVSKSSFVNRFSTFL